MRSFVLKALLLSGLAASGASLGAARSCDAANPVACDTLQDDPSMPALVQLQKKIKLATGAGSADAAEPAKQPEGTAAAGASSVAAVNERAVAQVREAPPRPLKKAKFYQSRIIDKVTAKEKLAAAPRILGCTQDFWILWGICLGGCIVCLLAVVISVNVAVSSKVPDIKVEVDAKGRLRRPVIPVGFLQRVLFRADMNPTFAYNAEMATRAALVCALCSLTYFVDGLKFINDFGISMQYAVVILVFTVYGDVGTTLSLAWYNFAGTVLPVINCMIMYSIFPNGSSDDGVYSVVWWIGFADFMLFMLAMMLMKWPVGIRMFAVSWQAYFSMCFLDPTDDTTFSNGLTEVVLTGAAAGPLVATVIGCVLAVLSMCTFWPFGPCMSCLSTAQTQALTLSWEEGHLWGRMVKYFKGSEKTVLVDKLIGETEELHSLLQAFTANLGSNSWWECFDQGRAGRVRAYMLDLCDRINYMNDWLRGGVFAIKHEDFSDEHDKMMEKVGAQLERLSSVTSVLLYRATLAAVDGGVAPLGRIPSELLQKDINAVNEAQRELAVAFKKARRDQYNIDFLTHDAVPEHFFVFAVSLYGQYTMEFAEFVLSGKVDKPAIGLIGSAIEATKDMCSFTGWGFASRSCIGFFLAFGIGYKGIPGILSKYNGTVAGTTAYLMASDGAAGSAIMKNIARFQGTGGGTIIGQLIWSTVVSCTWRGSAAGFASTLLLIFISMYLYFSSNNFGYVGLLLAAFGAQHVMLNCEDASLDDKGDIYSVIEEQMLAILCVTLGDILVGNTSPGHLATTCYHNVTEVLTKGFSDFYCLERGREVLLSESKKSGPPEFFHLTDVKNVEFHRDAILANIAQANFVGNEAPLEPRWFRTPWRGVLWQEMLKTISRMGNILAIMEYAVARGESAGNVRRGLITSPSMSTLGKDVKQRMDLLFLLAKKLMTHEDEGKFGVSQALIDKTRKEKMLALSETEITQIAKDVLEVVSTGSSLQVLTQDEGCQLGVVLLMMQGMMIAINSLENVLFGQKELLNTK